MDNAQDLLQAELLVLPGVGAFSDGMHGLAQRDLIKAINDYVAGGRPLLGICLGMQLLMDQSHEFGCHKGLGLIPGQVLPFLSADQVADQDYRIPHVGWNNLICPESASWQDTLLEGMPPGTDAYFVHSFKVVPENQSHVLAQATYGDQTFCSAIKKDNITAAQFHPEKSGPDGMNMLRNYCQQVCKGVLA